MLITFFNFLLEVTQSLGYFGVGILMAIESSFIPMPSEIIVPPAAYLASLGIMNIYLVIFFGVLGSVVGAVFNYVIAYYLGRPLVYKLAKYKIAKLLLISPEKIMRAEEYFLKNSFQATLFGRLIPVVRQLISLPAGFSKMPFFKFIISTTIGSFIWVTILAILGYFIGSKQELLKEYYREISWILLFLVVLFIIIKILKNIKKGIN